MAKVHAGLAKHGDAFFALQQTGGKGQRGKTWHTGNGENIALSIVVEPKRLPLAEQFRISAASALVCCDFFSTYAGEETSVKWPNDIYWRDRKAGGILIENVIGRNTLAASASAAHHNLWKYAVIGIGINVNQSVFEQQLTNAVSLRQITGRQFDVANLAKALHQLVLERMDSVATEDFNELLDAYNARLFRLNCPVKLKKGTVEFETTIKGVTKNGQLYTTDVIDNYFGFGEVEWIL
jgi:BirA family biotin operon repressor/biotin-[acetyl-CoA-carboxylase] ligase